MPTQSKPKLRADAERNRVRILEAGEAVFAERGLAATMDDVAERAGVGVGTVYRRFPDKADLIDAIFEVHIGEVAEFAEQAREMDDPFEGLVHFLRHAAELHTANRALRELIFGSGHGHGFVDRALDRVRPAMAEVVARAKESGQLREDFEVLDLPLLQISIAALNDYVGEAAPDAWRRVLPIILDGMRASARRTPLAAPAMEPEQLRSATGRLKPPTAG